MIRHVLKQRICAVLRMIALHLPDDRRYRTSSNRILVELFKYVLTDNRHQMIPQLFEALVFLKMNHRFWDARLISEAIGGARSERAKARMDAHELFRELEGEGIV